MPTFDIDLRNGLREISSGFVFVLIVCFEENFVAKLGSKTELERRSFDLFCIDVEYCGSEPCFECENGGFEIRV